MPTSSSQNFYCQCPCPRSEPQPPPTSVGNPPTLAARSGSVSYGMTAPSPGSWLAHYFVCALQEWSLCFPSPVEVLQSNPSSLQSLILWEFPLPLPEPQVGKPDVGLRTFTPVGGLLWYNCSPVCESPTQRLWDLILLWLCPSYLCLWMWSIFFGEFQCLPVNDCSAVSCDSGALTRGSSLSFLCDPFSTDTIRILSFSALL